MHPELQSNIDIVGRSENVDGLNIDSNMPDYFTSSTNREEDQMASQLFPQRIHYDLSDVFYRKWVLQEHI